MNALSPVLRLAFIFVLVAGFPAHASETFPFDGLSFRHLGPVGNRVPAVAGVPGTRTLFAGAASGGLFRSVDDGLTWKPVFDDQDVASIGALAVAPSDPNVVWVGTGESFIRSNVSIGNGVYRSTDGGDSWSHLGLQESGRIGRIVVHPDDADVAWVAVQGHSYGPQKERGLYRTVDGGLNWEQVLFVSEDAGVIDVALKPGNPRILYAASWEFVMSTSGRTSGGPGSGLFRSKDGGETWDRLEGSGLPTGPWGKIGLAVSAERPDRVWALIETSSNSDFAEVGEFQGVLWRSDDAGDSWQMINRDNALSQRPLYYTRAVAAPDNGDEITFMAVRQSLSIDGGLTTVTQNSGWDHHDLWIDPSNPERRISGHDGGVSVTHNRGESWLRPQLPIAQLYHVATDDEVPYNVYGNRQDGPTFKGPSRSLGGGSIPISAWTSVGGCEVGFALPDPRGDGTVWSGCYDGILERFDANTGISRDVSVWPLAVESWAAADLEYRFQWNHPLAISPHDPDIVLAGSQYVHRTRDGGASWERISPDLTTADPVLMQRRGGLTLDDAGPTIAPVVFSIAFSPLNEGEIWAGTNDGLLHLSLDDGVTWQRLELPDVPPLGTVIQIEPSKHSAGSAYVAVDRHQEGDAATYLFKTEDHGATWRSLRSDLPQSVFSFAKTIREDPRRSGLLYLGTENGLWVSFDDGSSWHRWRAGLPPAPVSWIEVQERFNDLVLSTYGRGFWVLDDLTPLQEMTLEGPLELAPPRPTYRFVRRSRPIVDRPSAADGKNPDSGVPLTYFVRGSASDREDDEESEVTLRVLAADGHLVRELKGPSSPGLHRVSWNLLETRTPAVKLRLPPKENPYLPPGKDGLRNLPDGGRFALRALPGTYTVELTLGERTVSQSLQILPDPTSLIEEIEEQRELLQPLRASIEEAANVIHSIEAQREQIVGLLARLEDVAESGLLEDLDGVRVELEEIENRLFDLRLTGAGQDTLRWPRKLYARLTYLARRVQMSDAPPTLQHRQVAELLEDELRQLSSDYLALQDRIGGVNDDLAAAGLAGILP
ncbi:MAG: hypothetical protein AAGK22_06760 [Acidobacteriota bacterium]